MVNAANPNEAEMDSRDHPKAPESGLRKEAQPTAWAFIWSHQGQTPGMRL